MIHQRTVSIGRGGLDESREPQNRRIVFHYFAFSLAFGVVMGLVFPIYAGFFVVFKSAAHRAIFTAGCVVAGVAVGLFGFLIGNATVLSVVREIARRLGDLGAREGDLTTDLSIRSDDCIGTLADNFNRFQESLRTMIRDLLAIAERTQRVGFDLSSNSTETSSASTQISSHMSLIREQTELLIEEAVSVDDARAGINAAAEEVSRNIDRQSDSLTRLSALVERSVEGIKRIALETDENTKAILSSIAESGESVDGIARVARKIGEIDASVAGISELVGAINGISESINVLGINASIEAAHAGDAGKGFAVVASEIRKLADNARANANGIVGRLDEVVALVGDGVALSHETEATLTRLLADTKRNADSVSLVTERLLGFAANADQMMAAHCELVRASIDVTNSMVSMRDHTGVIEGSMRVLLDTAERNGDAIEEITRGIEEIAADVVELNRVSATNAENVRTLAAMTARFRLGT